MNTQKRRLVSALRGAAAFALTIGCASLGAQARSFPLTAASVAFKAIPQEPVFMYNSEGVLVDVTASVVYQNPYVLDLHGNVIGDVDVNGIITDPVTDAVIGYVAQGI